MYLALYRKYRPKTFDDVISQPQIVTTLKNQISTGQNTHAYLFTGSRGTGKTTCAKILAMALNCKHPVNGNPCLECESCREIDSGTATDVVEMDAASNNKVEDVHILQDQLAYTPVSCKYRVYIVDEVHMLTASAFNALLKTIEEPPAHVIFILATTELHKVPATIMSRCQRFEFRRIEIADSSARLLSVAENEGVSLTQGAADMISRLSDGGMRDALSLLDRCISVSREVSEDTVRDCAGVADNRHLYQFAEMIAAQDIPGCIRLLEQLYKGGKDIARIMDELSSVFRDLMLCKSAPGENGLLSVMPADHPEIERLSGMFTLDDILRCLTVIQECADGISKTRQRRTLAEMCFVKLCTGAQSAAFTAAAVSAPVQQPRPVKPAEYKPMGSEFAPLPDEKLKPKQAAAVNEIRKIFSQTEPEPEQKPQPEVKPEAPAAEVGQESKINQANQSKLHELLSENVKQSAEAENTADVPPPEQNSKPAAPDLTDFAPPPEEPPEEFIPQREFDTAPAASPKPVKPAEPEAPRSAPEEAKQPEQEKGQQEQEEYSKLESITPDEWNNIVSSVRDALYAAMLEDSSASVNPDGVLEIRSGNLMLQGMAARNSRGLEEVLSAAFGRKIRALVINSEQETAAEDENSAVKELLEKAKRLNIEVQIK